MIISASRRTDIPNYYSDWFFKRLEEGYVYVRNPINAHQISKISLSSEVVDCFVFWTKNPSPMLEKLDKLNGYDYYFQFTLTGYGKDVEPNLPDKKKVLIPAFRKLSEKIGKEKVIWRYDPVLLNEKYTQEYHLRAFAEIAESLSAYTEKVVISFVDLYEKTRRNVADLRVNPCSDGEIRKAAGGFARIAERCGLKIETCAEQIDLLDLGIGHGSCIDGALIERIIGFPLRGGKDKNQREECGCFESVDIGGYNTCANGCKYCYANFSGERVKNNLKRYRLESPLLCGEPEEKDIVTERKMQSLKECQMSFLDK